MIEGKTICAISTPSGAGGIGIVRISGLQSLAVAQQLFRSKSGRALSDARGYSGMLGRVYDAQGEVDDAIAFVYRSPYSYTGEDVVEISCHGGSWVLQRVLRLCIQMGAQAAAPGEFTKRAFLNGKLGLSDAEAVMQLIEAQGDAALRAALSARDGALSTAVDAIVQKLLEQSAHLAAWADYPEEEMEAVEGDVLATALRCIQADILHLLSTWDCGKILRDGIDTVIVGRPNVGKSTLMNLLAGDERSIVTAIPGTTRDIVEERVLIGDRTLRLADTAGLRKTGDVVESIGVEKAMRRMETADLVLAVFDSSDALSADDYALLESLRQRPCIAVINKADLVQRLDTETISAVIPRVITISAVNGQGREALQKEIDELFSLQNFDPTAAMVATERQRHCLMKAEESVREALEALQTGVLLDAVSVLLDEALDSLLALTGRKVTDAIVDEVFSHFCVGK